MGNTISSPLPGGVVMAVALGHKKQGGAHKPAAKGWNRLPVEVVVPILELTVCPDTPAESAAALARLRALGRTARAAVNAIFNHERHVELGKAAVTSQTIHLAGLALPAAEARQRIRRIVHTYSKIPFQLDEIPETCRQDVLCEISSAGTVQPIRVHRPRLKAIC